jgi:hypothetical protein
MSKETPFVYCLRPKRIINPFTKEPLVVPCGHCSACASIKASRYAEQCTLEGLTSAKVYFVTLTYANSYIPRAVSRLTKQTRNFSFYEIYDHDTGELLENYCTPDHDEIPQALEKAHLFGALSYPRYEDIQLFLKRLRWRLSNLKSEKIPEKEEDIKASDCIPASKLRFFCSPEYGPETYRIHYHFLFFTDSEEFEPYSGHTLGDYPQWTWPLRKDPPATSGHRLSYFEWAVREAWKFGRVDCESVGASDCSQYVAGYITSPMSLPPVYQLSTFSLRSRHSQFLGRRYFMADLKQALLRDPRELVSYVRIGDTKSRERPTPFSIVNYLYPKCLGFNPVSNQRDFSLYKLYDVLTSDSMYGNDLNMMDLSKSVVEDVIDCVYLRKTGYSPFQRNYLSFLSTYAVNAKDFPKSFDFSDDEMYYRYVLRLYRMLSVSKRFCSNARILGVSLPSFYNRIVQFWSWVDYVHLRDWIESQQLYFESDFSAPEDLDFFYNNTDADFENAFLKTEYYRRFYRHITRISLVRSKNKRINDKLIFSEDG